MYFDKFSKKVDVFLNVSKSVYRHIWETGSAFAAVYTRRSDDAFQRIFNIDGSNPDYDIINRIYQNTGRATNTGLELLWSQEIKDFWKFSLGTNFYQIDIEGYSGTLLFPTVRSFTLEASTGNSFDLKFNNQFTLPKNWKVQLTAIYLAPRNIPQGRELTRSSVDFAVSRPVFAGKGELVLAATDLFNGFGLRQEIDGEGFTAEYRNFFESQSVRVGVNYKW